jgi:ATP-dependent RNA helicase DeaD
MNDFKSLGLSDQTLATLEKKGFKIPTEIQALAIPLLLENKVDIIAQAQTGTGKTAVFALPLIQTLDTRLSGVKAIILAPTRELVIQVCEEIDSLRGNSNIRTAAIYGGQSIDIQLKKLRRGVDIVVGTPGRIMDHLNRRTLVLNQIQYFILDEADEMLNMGFIEDIEEILTDTPKEKRVLLFSATMPKQIKKLAENYMGEYTHIRSEVKLTTDLTEQIYFEVSRRNKVDALTKILEIETDFYGIVFCRTKADVDELTTNLYEKGMKVDNLHGDITQTLREKILGKFRNKKINILVATDVAARGIDVEDLTHVINYSIPMNPEAYVHRIGRTGRAGKKGTAITFVTPAELRKMKFIQKFTQADIVKQQIPQRQEIVQIRKKRVEGDIEQMLTQKNTEGYRKWAKELLEESSGEDIVTALLKYSFGGDLEDRPPGERRGRDDRVRDWKRDDRGPSDRDNRRSDNRDKKWSEDRGRDRNRDDRGPSNRDRRRPNDRGPSDRDSRRSNDRGPSDRDNRQDRPPADKKPSEPGEESRNTRLVMAMGKDDNLNKTRLVEMVKGKAGTDPRKISNIEILENMSYFTVPARDAKSILKFFRRTMMGKIPLIKKAGEDQKQGPKGKSEGKKDGRKRFTKERGRFVRP